MEKIILMSAYGKFGSGIGLETNHGNITLGNAIGLYTLGIATPCEDGKPGTCYDEWKEEANQ